MKSHKVICCLTAAMIGFALGGNASANPTLKGTLTGIVMYDPDAGTATFTGGGNLTLMGKVAVCGEFLFEFGEEPGTLEGVGVCAFVAANGDILVSNVNWFIDAAGNGDLEFRWPGEITFSNGVTVESTGRFVELPFAGLRGTSTESPLSPPLDENVRIRMTGEIVDPDPLDR